MKFADLHLHTQFSDGTFSPEELVAWLKQFHTGLAEALHNGEAVADLLPE